MTTTSTVTTLDQLKGLVGQELGVGQWFEVTQEQVNQFADVTGDHQFIHVDPERAKGTPYGGTIAHGYLTLSLMLQRERDGVQIQLPMKMAVNYGLNRVRFPNAVKVGKRIRSRTKVVGVEEVSPGVVQLTQEVTSEVEGESKPAMVAESLGRFYL
jgi:acyl dehydratase